MPHRDDLSRDLRESVQSWTAPGADSQGGQTVMGWERRGPYTYYIRKQTIHGRTVRTSYGRGQAAQIAAAEDAQQRHAREAERAERAYLAQLDQQLDAVIHLLESLVSASLVVAGYHQHHRSEWRKRHEHDGRVSPESEQNAAPHPPDE